MNKRVANHTVEIALEDADLLSDIVRDGAFEGPAQAIGTALGALRARQLSTGIDDETLDRLLDEDERRGGEPKPADEVFTRLKAKYQAIANRD